MATTLGAWLADNDISHERFWSEVQTPECWRPVEAFATNLLGIPGVSAEVVRDLKPGGFGRIQFYIADAERFMEWQGQQVAE